MRCLAVCQDELVIRMLDEILQPGFDVEFIVENRAVARRLHDAHIQATAGDPRRADTFVKADLGPSTCVIVEDHARRGLKKILDAVRDGGGALVYVLGTVLHDWDDQQATAILRTIARHRGARVLIIDAVIPPGNEPHGAKWLDLLMLAITGRERTEPEWHALVEAAGLELVSVQDGLIEARCH